MTGTASVTAHATGPPGARMTDAIEVTLAAVVAIVTGLKEVNETGEKIPEIPETPDTRNRTPGLARGHQGTIKAGV